MEYGTDTPELTGMLAAAMEAAPKAVLITDSNTVLFANAETRRILKCDGGRSLAGRLVIDLVHPDGLESARMRGEVLKRSDATLRGLPVKLVALDGSAVSLIVSGTPVEFGGRRVFMFTDEG